MEQRLSVALAAPRKRYRPVRVEGHAAGWVDDEHYALLAKMSDVFAADAQGLSFVDALDGSDARSSALEKVARALAADGHLSAWRDERYAVGPTFGGPTWFRLERAAARFFGIHTYAAHVNGLGGEGTDPTMWLARRSPIKAIDPSMLDNLVGGGIAAGQSVAGTVVKESAEEAGIDATVARRARPVGAVHICREQPGGLQRETIFVHDLRLPADFAPASCDGEVVEFRRVTLEEAARLIGLDSGPDVVTADASLVVLDFLIRHGGILPDAPGYPVLEALRHPQVTMDAKPA